MFSKTKNIKMKRKTKKIRIAKRVPAEQDQKDLDQEAEERSHTSININTHMTDIRIKRRGNLTLKIVKTMMIKGLKAKETRKMRLKSNNK